MRTRNVQATRATRGRSGGDVKSDPSGDVGETITGGFEAQADLTEILTRGVRGVGGAGAVSAAAQVAVSDLDHSRAADHGFALSDGSRISFASIADEGVLGQVANDERPSEKAAASRRRTSGARASHRFRVLTTA